MEEDNKGWAVLVGEFDTHVIPLNDLKEHIEMSTCDCLPKAEIMEDGNILIAHNSYDGREEREI